MGHKGKSGGSPGKDFPARQRRKPTKRKPSVSKLFDTLTGQNRRMGSARVLHDTGGSQNPSRDHLPQTSS